MKASGTAWTAKLSTLWGFFFCFCYSMWRFTLNNSNAETSRVGHIPSRAICKYKATFHFASSVDDQMYLWSGQWDTLKYACCTETKAKGISTSSYFLYKVTVSMATGWWLVFPPYFLSIFSLLSSYLQYLCLKTPRDHCRSDSLYPTAVLHFSILPSPFLKPSPLKD